VKEQEMESTLFYSRKDEIELILNEKIKLPK
jgi:hypothetical protein